MHGGGCGTWRPRGGAVCSFGHQFVGSIFWFDVFFVQMFGVITSSEPQAGYTTVYV